MAPISPIRIIIWIHLVGMIVHIGFIIHSYFTSFHDMGGGALGIGGPGTDVMGGGAIGTGIGSIGGGAPDAISSALRRALLARNSAISLS